MPSRSRAVPDQITRFFAERSRSGGAAVAALGVSTFQVEGIAGFTNPSAMPNSPAAVPGTITQFEIVMGQKAFAAGESVVLTLRKNGTSIVTTPITLNSATPTASLVPELPDLTSKTVAVGDEFTLTGVYTAGGTPANPDFSVVLTWG